MRIISFFYFFLLVMVFTGFGPANAQQEWWVVTIKGVGGKTGDQKRCRDSSEWASVVTVQLEYWHDKGYLHASDSFAVEENKNVSYIHTGDRIQAGTDFVFLNNSLYDVIRNGKYYSHSRNRANLEKYIKDFGNKGYPFARIQPDSFFVSASVLSFRYEIHPGPFIINDTLALQGDRILSRRFMEKYLQIIPGKPYSEKVWGQAVQRISQLGFVTMQRPPDTWFGSDKARMNIYLKKKGANQFYGIAGIVPPGEGETRTTVTGDVSLNLVNTFRNADKIQLIWKKYDRFGQQLDASVVYPYLFYLPTGVDLRFRLQKKDTSYINTVLNWGIPFYFQASNHAGLLLERQRSQILGKTPLPNTADFARNAGGIYLKFENYDRPLIPRKGAGLALTMLTGKKEIFPTDDSDPVVRTDFFQQTGRMDFNHPFSRRLGIRLTAESGFLSGDHVLKNELFLLGGYKTLRGFLEESIEAQNFISGCAEFKAFFGDYSNGFVFYNHAFYNKRSPVYTSDDPWGFGWGIELETPAGILAIAYAIGSQFDNPISIRDSKVHISLLNRF